MLAAIILSIIFVLNLGAVAVYHSTYKKWEGKDWKNSDFYWTTFWLFIFGLFYYPTAIYTAICKRKEK